MCCKRLAGNTGRKKWCKKIAIWAPSHNFVGLYDIFAIKACIDNRKKNLLSSNISSRCPYNIVNFGPLTADIDWRVWGTPGNFNGFLVLAALLHGSQVAGVSQTAALNRGRHLCSAGRPSRWALAHILVCLLFIAHMQSSEWTSDLLNMWCCIYIILFRPAGTSK